MRNLVILLMVTFLACRCAGEPECRNAPDCFDKTSGQENMICLNNSCWSSEPGKGDVKLNIGIDLSLFYQVCSAIVYVYHPYAANDSNFSCSNVGQNFNPEALGPNLIKRTAIYNFQNCQSMQFFMGLVPTVPAGRDRIIFIRGYEKVNHEGALKGAACIDKVNVVANQTTNVNLTLTP